MTRKDPTPKDTMKPNAIEPQGAPQGYDALLQDIKTRIQTARVQAALAVNRELVLLYWEIGRDILRRQEQQGWGSAVIEQLTLDLQSEFPGMAGLSSRNLWRMRAFAQAHSTENLPQPVAEIPWRI